MTTVTNTLVDSSGDPIINAPVSIRLLAPTETNESFVTADDRQVASRITTKTNNLGKWVIDLIPNADIEPSGSQYEVVTTFPGFDSESLLFVVPVDGATPTVWSLHDLLV